MHVFGIQERSYQTDISQANQKPLQIWEVRFFFKKKAQEPMELQFQNNMEKAYEKGKAGNEARTDRMED